jgi:hypothetical protein
VRLEVLSRGHKLRHKLLLALMRFFTGMQPPDVVKTLLYRPELFGRPFSALTHATLRGPSAWSVGERELFAAFTSKLNGCRF